jgi:DNA polymerase-3 subunit epsilon
VQHHLVDLDTPLYQVTFVVVDLETTGGSPELSAITEIGAVKLRGGECLGTFQTLVNPGVGIPPEITYLTGVTEAMVTPAPRIEAVLPALLEFVGSGTVVVGHNVRFDLAFLRQALLAHGYPRLAHQFIDTCALARRLVQEEVPNCKLSTLADYFRLATRPTHRAFDDARATGELLHRLLERAGSMGVTALDDLLALPTVRGHPQLAKLRLTAPLPRRPGVYIFRDAGGRPLYVGKAVDLRRRVRSYFTGEGRRKIGPLLRELAAIDHIETGGELEAAVLEVRLIHDLKPRFNRQLKRWRRYAYLKLTLDERFPRLSVVRAARPGDGCLYLGPLASSAAARSVADAIETALPLRRCRLRPSAARPRPAPCTPAQLGVASCPCAGAISADDYQAIVATVVRALTDDPSLVLGPLATRIRTLAAAGRFEEAADVRDRAAAFARALTRQRRMDAMRRAGRITLDVAGEGRAVLEHGRLVADDEIGPAAALPPDGGAIEDGPVPIELADELTCVAAFMQARAERIRVIECSGELAWPLPALPRFEAIAGSR